MNTRKIKSLEKKVHKEVQSAIDAIYKKHNKEMVALIAEQIPKGKSMTCGNGIAIVGNEHGRAWGVEQGENDSLNYISSLQYSNKFRGGFDIPLKIKSTK
jgi:hypothetical protein